jgi:Zn-finger nucleic acid-binding protein
LFDGVSSCVRCEGLWIAQPTIDRAFQDPLWPGGPAAWWRRELNCPVCLIDGNVNMMVAILDGNVVLDRCRGHGLWLDAGELGRVLHTEDNGIAELYARLYGTQMPAEMLRKLTGEEIARQRHQAAVTREEVDKLLEHRREAIVSSQAKREQWQQELEWAEENVERLEAQLVRAREHLQQQERELTAARALLRSIRASSPTSEP